MTKDQTINTIEHYLRKVKKVGKYNWYKIAAMDIYEIFNAESPYPSTRDIVRKAIDHYSKEPTGFMAGAKFVMDYMIKQGKSSSYK